MKSKYLGNDVLPCYLTKPLLCADDVYSFFTMELSAFRILKLGVNLLVLVFQIL